MLLNILVSRSERTSRWLWWRSQSLASSFFRGISSVFPVLFAPVWAALVACDNTSRSEAVCLLPTFLPVLIRYIRKCTLWQNMQWEWCSCMPIPCIALRESRDASTVTTFAHCQLNDFILAAIEWAQRDFRVWFRVSTTQIQYNVTTHPRFFLTFFFLRQSEKPTVLLTLHLVFTIQGKKKTLNMMPAEPGALIKYTRTQICTFCQSGGGFPTETRGWVSQNLNLKNETSF